MIKNLVNILNSKKELYGWRIIHTYLDGKEAYFIKNTLDMCRGKDIEKYEVTIFKKFQQSENTSVGSYTFFVHPTMSGAEIEEELDNAIYACQYALNPSFSLTLPSNYQPYPILSNLKSYQFDQLLGEIVSCVLNVDEIHESEINSFEVFLEKKDIRLIISTGIDYKATTYLGNIEYITNYQGEKEEIELYDFYSFANYNEQDIKSRIFEQLRISKDRGNAIKTPNLGLFNVILKDESVRKVLNYFNVQTDLQSIYQKVSKAKLNQFIQNSDASGDKITLQKVPFLVNSPKSLPFDLNGVILKPITVIDEGRVINYHGDSKIASYLNQPTVGIMPNSKYNCGSTSINELKTKPYLEVVSFSNLQVDPLIGTIGGEIRLGYFFDGTNVIPVTGGSISGNIMDIINDFKLSKESVSFDSYEGPKYLLAKLIVTGND